MTYITALLVTLLLLSACNNDRTQRLNASGNCRVGVDDVEPDLTESEAKVLESVILPKDVRLAAVNFTTTVELMDTNDQKVFITLSGVIIGDTVTASANCSRNLSIDSVLDEPAVFTIPAQNGSADFTEVEITIEGRAGENENLPFSTINPKIIKPIESAADDTTVAPKPFSSYFEGEATAAFQLIKGDNKENEFRYHIVNENLSESILKVTTRMNLIKVVVPKAPEEEAEEEEEKKEESAR